MNKKNKDFYLCVICDKSFTEPLRKLPCGDGYCEACLANLPSSSAQLRCGKCQKSFLFNVLGIKTIQKIEDLEFEKKAANKNNHIHKDCKDSPEKESLSNDAVSQLKQSSKQLQKERKYVEAIKTLEAIIVNANPVDKILASFDKVLCLIATDQVDEAFYYVIDILSLIDVNVSTCNFKRYFDDVYQNLDGLTKKLIEYQQTSFVHLLMMCLINLSVKFCKGENLLIKLMNIGYDARKVSADLKKLNREEEFKRFYPLMEKIFKNMQITTCIDWEMKCMFCASFLYEYGLCCIHVKDWEKSIDINNQAKGIMETTIIFQACEYELLDKCYNNLGVAYENLNKLLQAKACYERAVSVYKESIFTEGKIRTSSLQAYQKNLKQINKLIRCYNVAWYNI